MLKSLVLVALCGCFLSIHFQAFAYDGRLSIEASSVKSMAYPRQMRSFVDSYIKENDMELAAVRDRSARPFTIIDSVMEHYDLPVELRYLAVIESELRATAVSRVGAKGPWQLMAATARDLGLKVNYRSDERTNYYKSTHAAALYLRDLHGEFKDWLLVLAAYNAGPVPVYRAINRAHSRNFWVLEKYLPAETRQHIRRFIATAYYFAVSEPAVDPIKVVPGGGQAGFAGQYAVLREGVGVQGMGVGVQGMGVGVQGMGEGVQGMGVGVQGMGVAIEGGDARVVFADLGGAGVLRRESFSALWRSSDAVL
jgi:Transglycosylase SLT domain